LDKKIKDNIYYEIKEIDNLLDSCKPLLDLNKLRKLDMIEAMASGSLLHSFYNGVEKVLIQYFKGINEKIDNNFNWHGKLLEQAFSKNENRDYILNNEYKEELNKYMGFRHLFRHTYNYKLDPIKLKPLLENVNKLWEKIKSDIEKKIS